MLRVSAHSIQGERKLKNQDAYGILIKPYPIIAVSDGHGAPQYDKSDLGAAHAISAALDLMQGICEAVACDASHTESAPLSHIAMMHHSYELVQKWQRLIRGASNDEAYLRYGATLLTAAYVNGWSFGFQIGDGAILIRTADGRHLAPIPEDLHLCGEETHSLCEAHAWLHVKAFALPLEQPPFYFGACTDGLIKAYPNGRYDYYEYFDAANELEDDDLKAMLQVASRFAHDDATAVLLLNAGAGSLDASNPSDPSDESADSVKMGAIEVTGLTEEPSALEADLRLDLTNQCTLERHYDSLAWSLADTSVHQRYRVLIRLIIALSYCGYIDSVQTVSEAILTHILKLPLEVVTGEGLEQNLRHLEHLDSKENRMHVEQLETLLIALKPMTFELSHKGRMPELEPALTLEQRIKAIQRDIWKNGVIDEGWAFKTAFKASHLEANDVLYGYDLGFSYAFAIQRIGQVVMHPQKGIWGLKNLGNFSWFAVRGSSGMTRYVKSGETIALTDQLTLYIHGIPFRVLWHSPELSYSES